MPMEKTARNGLIDINRMGFALLIVLYHFYSNGEKHFYGGRFGVEFFTILAGFLFFAAWDGKSCSSAPLERRIDYWKRYMKRRYLRFLGYTLVAFLLTFLVVRVWHNGIDSLEALTDTFSKDIWEILLIKMNGFNRGGGLLNAPVWTLCCMLFVEFLILGLLVFWERPFLFLFLPASLFVGCGWWMNLESANLGEFHTLFTFGMVRVYLLTCFGILSYNLSQRLRDIPLSKLGRWSLTVTELGGYLSCFLIACLRKDRYFQFCFIIIATVTIAISFSGKSYAGNQFPANRLTNFLAEYSFCIYLIHVPILRLFQYTHPDLNELYRQKFVFLFSVLIAGLLYLLLMRRMRSAMYMMGKKLRSRFLAQP